MKQTITGQSSLHGAFLWRQVDTIVELKQNWRARDDAAFVDFSIKTCSQAEFEGFKDAPIVVTRKFLWDALNDAKACNFAVKSHQKFEVYHVHDKIKGKYATMAQQRKLPLIPGMPVMITENTATSYHIVNGSRGILKSVTYDVDAGQIKFAVCALVDIPNSALSVPGLAPGVVPILPITSSFVFATSENKFNVRRTQLPILPGWAFTDFKIQGSFIPKVVVNLASAKSLQSIYVMLSQASCL
ncbi:uncharacterized protein HD556DRAFT_1432206 [Suillus plorans]|uniref:Uncharacterized protein n=1 Tax=Suillus plorans TaxID=116603 RepID=A0A9P7DHH0_9AGAM|nr:uncharacterized protein HD556DRAFT_1432206 [Suillus plorans]KAG1793650.1 hypothetical protein HD556DRAFT_1432206 [Suillus plorans]